MFDAIKRQLLIIAVYFFFWSKYPLLHSGKPGAQEKIWYLGLPSLNLMVSSLSVKDNLCFEICSRGGTAALLTLSRLKTSGLLSYGLCNLNLKLGTTSITRADCYSFTILVFSGIFRADIR